MVEKKFVFVQNKKIELTIAYEAETNYCTCTAKFTNSNLIGYCRDIDSLRAKQVSIHKLFLAFEENERKYNK